MSNQNQPIENAQTFFLRFNPLHRLEHWVFMASFTILAITGLAQRFAKIPLSQTIVKALGGIETTRQIHHISAIVMMFVAVYHIGAIGYRLYVRRVRMTMLPTLDDGRKAGKTLSYYLGFSKNPPQQGRYTFEEKLEYWAVVWGTLIMGITGFMMWNPIATAKLLPGGFIPASKTAHGLEAILAVASIFLWHFYHVLIKTFNRSMFIGKLSEEQMIDEHPLELADIKAGIAEFPLDPQTKKRRERRFFPGYGVIAAILVVAIVYFVSFEETAIATVSPISTVEVFVPLTPTPLPTPLPTPTPLAIVEAATWDTGIRELFNAKCASCHNSAALIGGLDLGSYESALLGGNSGPGIVPGDSDASQVVIIQAAGGHLGQFSDDELQLILDWIDTGGLQN